MPSFHLIAWSYGSLKKIFSCSKNNIDNVLHLLVLAYGVYCHILRKWLAIIRKCVYCEVLQEFPLKTDNVNNSAIKK